MVTVYIWDKRLSHGSMGHAALELNGKRHIYISWWPVREDPLQTAEVLGDYHVQAWPHLSVDEDIRKEGRRADHKLIVRGLNEDKIVDFWRACGSSRSFHINKNLEKPQGRKTDPVLHEIACLCQPARRRRFETVGPGFSPACAALKGGATKQVRATLARAPL